MNTLYIYFAVYILSVLGVSWFISRKEDSEGFLIANRDRKWWMISLSKFAGAIGAGYFVAYTGYAYEYGIGVYLLLVGSVIGYSLFGFWAVPKVYKNSRKEKFYTQGDFTKHATGSVLVGNVTNHITNVILFCWLMVGTIGGAKIISHFGLMSYEFALLATVGVVTTYILLAGFRAILATDILQAIIIVVLMIIITYVIIGDVGIANVLATQTGSVDIGTSIGFLLFGILSVFSYSNLYQVVYAANNGKSARTGIVSSVAPVVFIASLLMLIGMYMYAQNPELDSGLVFLEALTSYVPSGLLPLTIVLFFAGLMSSADTNIYGMASHYVLNQRVSNPVKGIRYVIIAIGLLTFCIGFVFRDIVDMTMIAAAFSMIPSVAMIYVISGGKSRYRFFGSIVGGFIGFAVGLAIFGLIPTVAITVLAGTLLGLIFDKKKSRQ